MCGKEDMIFFALIISFFLHYALIFQVWTSPHWALSFSRTALGCSEYVCISANLQTRLSLLQSNILWPFWSRPFFVPVEMHSFAICLVSFRVTCWMFVILLLACFHFLNFLFQLCITLTDCLSCNKVQVSCNFLFLMWLSLWMLYPII